VFLTGLDENADHCDRLACGIDVDEMRLHRKRLAVDRVLARRVEMELGERRRSGASGAAERRARVIGHLDGVTVVHHRQTRRLVGKHEVRQVLCFRYAGGEVDRCLLFTGRARLVSRQCPPLRGTDFIAMILVRPVLRLGPVSNARNDRETECNDDGASE